MGTTSDQFELALTTSAKSQIMSREHAWKVVEQYFGEQIRESITEVYQKEDNQDYAKDNELEVFCKLTFLIVRAELEELLVTEKDLKEENVKAVAQNASLRMINNWREVQHASQIKYRSRS